jgi:hypothetical protein
MLIALLAILRVDLIVIVAFAVFVFGRRRWLRRQPGEFAGAIQVSGGAVGGLSPKWKRGSGRWVRDVLVWSKAPFMFRNEPIPVDRLCGEQPVHPGVVYEEAQARDDGGEAEPDVGDEPDSTAGVRGPEGEPYRYQLDGQHDRSGPRLGHRYRHHVGHHDEQEHEPVAIGRDERAPEAAPPWGLGDRRATVVSEVRQFTSKCPLRKVLESAADVADDRAGRSGQAYQAADCQVGAGIRAV